MKKLSVYLPLAVLLLVGGAGCSKSSDATPAPAVVPQEYQVEYRVSSTGPVADYVAYNDEKNASITLATTSLPLSRSFKRTMSKGDYLTLSATTPAAMGGGTTTLTTSILLNGKEMRKSQSTALEPRAVSVYVIGE